jgi:glucosamine 6-phosphate synthetase-like amidotransferase/phosphosugar isomerase protein
VRTAALVNNVNSTLAQEQAEIVVPLRCGPEVAVPATKSFVAQMAVLYGLACRLAEALGAEPAPLRQRWLRLLELPALIERALVETAAGVEEVAERLALRPSLHLLGTRMWPIAKEGALKIREVVLNHSEGYEASEFKHGPNTILGRNTLYGPDQLERWAALLADPAGPTGAQARYAALDVDYPLIYLTGPDRRDVALTISQLNTHKIRGSETVVIAEPDDELWAAANKAPAGKPGYQARCLALPPSGDTLTAAFTATVVLQRLALRMSERKAAWLDARGLVGHGVHPDVPKNVSKSITVD